MARFAVGALLVLHFLASIATAQDAMSGIPSFSTQEATRYESLNIANGNVMVEIPVRHKSGKIPFALDLIGNFHAVLNASSSWGVSGWTPIAVQSGVYGAYAQSFVTLSQHVLCNGQLENLYSASVIDSLGTSHPTGLRWDDFGCFGSFPQTATTSDGSGFTVTYTSKTAWTLWDKSGNHLRRKQ